MTPTAGKPYFFEDLAVGLEASMARTVSEADIVAYAALSGDYNPIHLDREYAAKTPFKARIAHGILSAGYISAVFGMQLPGPGSVYISQTLNFRAPVRIGDHVEASVEVVELVEKGRRVKLACRCKVGDTLVLEGEALVKVPGKPEGY